MADEALAVRAQEGDDRSRHAARALPALRPVEGPGILPGWRRSDDIEQEGMIGLFKAIRDFRPDREASFPAFAELCVTRQIITAIKTATRRKHRPLNQYLSLGDSPTADELPHHRVPDPADELVSPGAPGRHAGLAGPHALRAGGRRARALRGGTTYQEIGEQLGRQVKSIDNALQRVKRKLDGHLAARTEETDGTSAAEA